MNFRTFEAAYEQAVIRSVQTVKPVVSKLPLGQYPRPIYRIRYSNGSLTGFVQIGVAPNPNAGSLACQHLNDVADSSREYYTI